MLVKADTTGKTKSIFKCDRCKKKLINDKDERYVIYIQKIPMNRKIVKTWDLCDRCFSALCRGIEKGVFRKESKHGDSEKM